MGALSPYAAVWWAHLAASLVAAGQELLERSTGGYRQVNFVNIELRIIPFALLKRGKPESV